MSVALLVTCTHSLQASRLIIKKTTRAMPKCPPENLGFGKVLTDHMLKIKWSKAHGWHAPEITPAAPIPLHPFSHVFHYAQEVGWHLHEMTQDIRRLFPSFFRGTNRLYAAIMIK